MLKININPDEDENSKTKESNLVEKINNENDNNLKLINSPNKINKNTFSEPNHPEKDKILNLNNQRLTYLLNFTEGENYNQDLSYHWYIIYVKQLRINKENNLKTINNNIYLTKKVINDLLTKRDITCELKVYNL